MLETWTKQLYRDYDRILYWYRISLTTPLIKICDFKSVWGQWCPVSCSITISRHLVESYPWHVVLEVLRHEMAHQMVTELWGQDDGHGPLFQQACDRLGLPGWARRATGSLAENYDAADCHEPSESQHRMLRKVEKLLSLANSNNENEAAVAMQRVREIYARYNLEEVAQDNSEKMQALTIYLHCRRVSSVETTIFSVLTGYFFVDVVFCDLFDTKAGEELKAVELLGLPHNLVMAEYVYHFLKRQLDSLWQEYRSRHHTARSSKRSFQLGVLAGFRKKLQGSETSVWQQASGDDNPNCTALVKPLTSR